MERWIYLHNENMGMIAGLDGGEGCREDYITLCCGRFRWCNSVRRRGSKNAITYLGHTIDECNRERCII